MGLFARRFVLRNCGRFLNVSSDFGSRYKTHTYISSEGMYAGLTREMTRREKLVMMETDFYNFKETYDLTSIPIWFTPGIFVNENLVPVPKSASLIDTNLFNVLDENYPGTGGGGKRKSYCPTYGSIEWILPGNSLLTYAFSKEKGVIERYKLGSVYLIGKKRTMFQIMDMSPMAECSKESEGHVIACQVNPDWIPRFEEYRIYAVTMRHLLVKGKYKGSVVKAIFPDQQLAFPEELLPYEIL